jgi:hypothetical protein
LAPLRRRRRLPVALDAVKVRRRKIILTLSFILIALVY